MGKFTNMNFDFICKISLEICKMGIAFAYELGLKSFLYEKSSTRKLYPNLTRGTPLNIFKILKNLTEKKLRDFQDLEAKKFKNFQTY